MVGGSSPARSIYAEGRWLPGFAFVPSESMRQLEIHRHRSATKMGCKNGCLLPDGMQCGCAIPLT